jgi:hypothetical protein
MAIPLTAELVGATAVVIVPVVGAAVAYMRLYVGRIMAILSLNLNEKLNGTYTRKEHCALAHVNLEKWLEKVDKDLTGMEQVFNSRLTTLETIARDNSGRDHHALHTHRNRVEEFE